MVDTGDVHIKVVVWKIIQASQLRTANITSWKAADGSTSKQ